MTESRELRFPYHDLAAIDVRCKLCGARAGFDLRDGRQRQLLHQDRNIICGLCGTQFDARIAGALRTFCNWLEQVEQLRVEVTFRVGLKPTTDADREAG